MPLQVLFLDCGDIRNVVFTASEFCTDGKQKLNLHVSHKSPLFVARNVFLTHVILSGTFNPTKDSLYLWNLWYSCLWDYATNNRFVEDLKKLMTRKNWTESLLNIPDKQTLESIMKIFRSWLKTATDTKQFYNMGLWQR